MMEAEYMASKQATKEAIWMTKLMKKLGYMKKKKAMVIQCDKPRCNIIDEESHATCSNKAH
jgi:hypothetical protein